MHREPADIRRTLLSAGFEESCSDTLFRKSMLDDDVTISVTLLQEDADIIVYRQLGVEDYRIIATARMPYATLEINVTISFGVITGIRFSDALSGTALSFR